MKLTAKETTSLRAMVELARHYGTGPTALNEVARVQELSLAYLERIAAELRRAGLLHSMRGACGGYVLALPPSEISIADVFRAVEGCLLPLDCMRNDGVTCDREDICASRNVWLLVEQRLSETLDNTTLADLLDDRIPGSGASDVCHTA